MSEVSRSVDNEAKVVLEVAVVEEKVEKVEEKVEEKAKEPESAVEPATEAKKDETAVQDAVDKAQASKAGQVSALEAGEEQGKSKIGRPLSRRETKKKK